MLLGSSHTFIQALGTARLGNCSSSDPPPAPGLPQRLPGLAQTTDPTRLWPQQLDWAHPPGLGANVKANGSLPSVVAPHSLGRWAAALVCSLKAGISCPPQRGLSPFCTTNNLTTGMDLFNPGLEHTVGAQLLFTLNKRMLGSY